MVSTRPIDDDLDHIPWTTSDALKGVALLLAATLFLSLLIVGLILIFKISSRESLLTVAFLSVLVDFLVVWLFTVKKYGVKIASLGLRWAKGDAWIAPLIALAGFVVIILIENIYANALFYITKLKPPDQPVIELFGRGRFGFLIAVVIAGLLAPLGEEIFFRGFVYAGLRRRFGVIKGVVLSSLVFAAFHFNLLLMIPLFFIGAALAILYEYRRSIAAPYIMHLLNNLGALLYLYYR